MELTNKFKDKKAWDQFIWHNTNPASFLQSWDWAQFNQEILGNQVKRLAVLENKELEMITMAIKKILPGNQSFWYCPRGPIWNKNHVEKKTSSYGAVIKRIGQDFKNSVFLRTLPPYETRGHTSGFIQRLGFKTPKILTHTKEPTSTIILDLQKTQDELLAKMHPKTRYNIRLAAKKGVTIRISNPDTIIKDTATFCDLNLNTAKRNKIHTYPQEYYKKLINFFTSNQKEIKLKLYLAEHDNKPLASIIVIYYGKTATYLHGASSTQGRQLMAGYLIQWQSIQDAKQAGMTVYDLWGIDESNTKWAGITKFKKGFGGKTINYVGAWDYILNKKWYNIFRISRIIKKIF